MGSRFGPSPVLLPPPLSWSAILYTLWYKRSVRLQLMAFLLLIELAAALLAGGVALVRARSQTRVEMAASMRLAKLLVADAANFVHQKSSAEQFLTALPAQLRSIRHVRITVKNAAGAAAAAVSSAPAEERSPAPAWFSALVNPAIEAQNVPIIVNGKSLGDVEIIGEPADEIAEVWDNLVAMGSVVAVLHAAMMGILYVLFGRVLDPLTVLATGLSDLERHSYGVQLPQPHARELAEIVSRFNALASALETARWENRNLNRRLLTAQDDERRRTALELHDEVGPCLFGLKAYASSITGAASELPEQAKQSLLECARESSCHHRAFTVHQSQHARSSPPDGFGPRGTNGSYRSTCE